MKVPIQSVKLPLTKVMHLIPFSMLFIAYRFFVKAFSQSQLLFVHLFLFRAVEVASCSKYIDLQHFQQKTRSDFFFYLPKQTWKLDQQTPFRQIQCELFRWLNALVSTDGPMHRLLFISSSYLSVSGAAISFLIIFTCSEMLCI